MSSNQNSGVKDSNHNYSFRFSRSSYYLMSVFIAILVLIVIVWWPLVEEYLSYYDPNIPVWAQIDWLLIMIFAVMSLLIMAGADIRRDMWIICVGLGGGLVIEAWGTQTNLWTYYTLERPPLWIIPAWPIASLSIDRLVTMISRFSENIPDNIFNFLYWIIFPAFAILMVSFVYPTLSQSMTLFALTATFLIIIVKGDSRLAVQTFLAGSGLGYFLELWGTTRFCWTYYTLQTPPVFAVFAHGLAAVGFWRSCQILKKLIFRRQNSWVTVK